MFNWNDFMNDFPYTNFSDINVSWFLNKFKQVFDEWEGLYNQMLSWKTATDEYNATWRTQQEQAFTTWENNFQSAIDAWKVQTENDIDTWETDTIATLEAWKAVFINQYNTLKAEVEQIAEDAETAKNSAQASATSAQQSADSASATALALQASLQQIDTNTGDISDLKTQLNNIAENKYQKIDVKTFFPNVRNFLSFSSQPAGSSPDFSIQCDYSASYNSYAFTPEKNCKIYVDSTDLITSYYSITIGRNAAQNSWIETIPGERWNLSCPNRATRYRLSENTLPTENNPLEITADDVIVITTRANSDDTPLYIDGYYLLGDSVSLAQTQLDQVVEYIKPVIPSMLNDEIKINSWKQSGGIVRDFDLCIPTLTKGKYFKYNIHKYTDGTKNSDGWVLNSLILVDENDNILMNICPSGEWEMAIKLSGQSDFIGLRNHGSEKTSYNKFYVDGNEVSASTVGEYTGKTFRMVQVTDMFLPDSPTTKCGTHYLEAIFDLQKIKFNQRVEWEYTGITGQGDFIAMLPIQRTNSGVQITDYAFDGNTFIAYDVSEAGFTNYMRDYIARNSISIYGTLSGIFATVTILSEMPSTHYAFVQNNDLYNKLYFSYIGANESINTGDVWEWKSEYEITFKDVT